MQNQNGVGARWRWPDRSVDQLLCLIFAGLFVWAVLRSLLGLWVIASGSPLQGRGGSGAAACGIVLVLLLSIAVFLLLSLHRQLRLKDGGILIFTMAFFLGFILSVVPFGWSNYLLITILNFAEGIGAAMIVAALLRPERTLTT
jgi:hypothetical protein